MPYASVVNAAAQAFRPVSAAIYMSYQGSPLNAKGRISVALITPTQSGITLPPASIADVQTLPFLSTLPAQAGFAEVKFLPIDPLSRSYCQAPGPFVRGLSTTGLNSTAGGALLILLDGGTAGDIIEFTVVQNLECIPLAQSTNLSTPTPSKSDPIELALVNNFVSSNPNLAIMQDRDATANKTAVTMSQQSLSVAQHDPAKHESGFLEKVLGGVKSVGGFIMDHGPQIAGLASTVAALAL